MDFHENTHSEPQNVHPSVPDQPISDIDISDQTVQRESISAAESATDQNVTATQPPVQQEPPYQSGQPYMNNQNQQPYVNNNGTPYQSGQPSSENNFTPPYQNGSPYVNNQLNQNGAPYGNGYNNSSYYDNHYTNYNNNNNYNYNNSSNYNGFSNNNSYNNNPYYNKNYYQTPRTEPGSSFATASMVLGIISIICCFTFTVYPAFVTGSIAVILALLSKGKRPRLLNKAQTGLTCAVIGLVLNIVLVISTVMLLFTNPDVRAEVNKTFKQTYGQTFDEMMKEIMEDNGYSY